MTRTFKDPAMQKQYEISRLRSSELTGGLLSAYNRGRMYVRGQFKRVPYAPTMIAYAAFMAGVDDERSPLKCR
jgi:hypothetical protein